MSTIAHHVGALAAVLMLGGCASITSIARDQFATTYTCPSEQVTLRRAAEESDGLTPIGASGCGHDTEYICGDLAKANYDYPIRQCLEEHKLAFEATDGTVHRAWPRKRDEASRNAAIASAAHDLPCEPAAIAVVGSSWEDGSSVANVLEGCGQRVTYELVAHRLAVARGVDAYRYTLVSRLATTTVTGAAR